VTDAGELAEGEDAQPTRLPRAVPDPQPPVLEELLQRHEVRGFRLDLSVLGRDDGVGRAVAAGRPVLTERFSDWLPAGAPVVARGAIAEVEIPPGLIERHRVAAQAQEAVVEGTAIEAVAPGVVRDDGPVLGRSEVVAPRPRRVRSIDDIFLGGVVEVSVMHSQHSCPRARKIY
jgi:hypothetical protein